MRSTALNVRVMISADNCPGRGCEQTIGHVKASPYADRVGVFAGIGFNGVGPGWAEKAIAQLEADVKAGAVGVGEISKGLGLGARKADGTRLHIDDPDLDPVWDACARLNMPVFIHTAEPQEFFEPIDMHNERWLELVALRRPPLSARAASAIRRAAGRARPDVQEASEDAVRRRAPRLAAATTCSGCRSCSTTIPNASTEVGAVLYDLGRQPRAAHDFFVKYQDRMLFGKDAFEPSEYPYYWRVFETKDEYFDYYRDYHAFWKLYGIDLPDDVLKKLYYQNAVRLVPGLPKI